MQDGQLAARPILGGRIRSLDGLRGVAAIIVLIHHSLLLFPSLSLLNASKPAQATPLEWALTHTPLHLVWAGSEAVLVFFVLSGLVLTLPVIRSTKFPWRAYYPGRLVRLYIPVLGSVVIAVVLALLIPRRSGADLSIWLSAHGEPVTFGQSLSDFFLLSGTSQLNGPLWSLQYEVLFSLLLPLYFFLTVWLRRFWAGLALVALALTVVGGISGLSAMPLRYMAVFALGVLMAVKLDDLTTLAKRINGSRYSSIVWGALTTIALVGLTNAWYPLRIGVLQFPIAVASAALLVTVAAFWARARAILESKTILWIGGISFSLYLTHEPIMVSLGLVLQPANLWLAPIVGIPLAILVGWAFSIAVEKPSHRLTGWVARRFSGV